MSASPEGYGWTSLTVRRGAELEAHYATLLRRLGEQKGMLGQIFTKAQNKITDPAKLFRLIDMVDGTDWVVLGADVKGDIYEGLLERNAEDTKSGAGQYFTPPRSDPRDGGVRSPRTGQDHRRSGLRDRRVLSCRPRLPHRPAELRARQGPEGVPEARYIPWQRDRRRHAAALPDEHVPPRYRRDDRRDGDIPYRRADLPAFGDVRYVLANPPFGKKSSMSFTNADGEQETDDLTYNRQDFWATTSNKQLNFVQHIRTMLKTTGRAAVVVPDNVLFEAGPARQSGENCCTSPTCTRSCGYQRASSMPRASRRMSSSSTTVRPAPIRRHRWSGTTTTAPTCITRSSRNR